MALDVAGLSVLRDCYVIYRKDKRLSPIAAAFRAFLLENGSRIIDQAVGGSGRAPRASPRPFELLFRFRQRSALTHNSASFTVEVGLGKV